MAFINHCGARRIGLEELNALPDPIKLTRKDWDAPNHGDHTPIRHDYFVGLAKKTLDQAGYDVTSEDYSLLSENTIDRATGKAVFLPNGVMKPKHDNLFGYLEVASKRRDLNNIPETTHVVGLRNSGTMDSKGILGCGERVFVCDNMCFSAEFVVARMHTSGIMDDLPALFNSAIGQLRDEFNRNEARLEIYKKAQMTLPEVHDVMMRTMTRDPLFLDDGRPMLNEKGAQKYEDRTIPIPASKLHAWLSQYKDPSYEDFRREDAWALKNAFTEVAKDWKFETMQKRTTKLTKVLDKAIDFEGQYNARTVERAALHPTSEAL